jgi:Flp pilus assembly protein TadD
MRKAWLAVFLLFSSGVFAAPNPGGSSEEDKLFAQLRTAGSAEEARPIERKLDALFKVSGSPTVDLLMTRAQAALVAPDKSISRKLLESVTKVAPNYAEGWRARASLQAASGDDSGAMVSLQKAVDLNPRHFEAMSDLAGMLEDYGDKKAALTLYRKALALDPQLSEAARHEKSLAKELEGQGI